MAMQIHDVIVKKPAELSDQEIQAWLELRATNPALYSPYFHPDFTRLMGELRQDAWIAIAYAQKLSLIHI